MRTTTLLPAAVIAALLAACGAPSGHAARPVAAAPSSTVPGPSVHPWYTAVQPALAKLGRDLDGGATGAALPVLQRDVAALQAGPPFPASASQAVASSWSAALADYSAGLAAYAEDDPDTGSALLEQGGTALARVTAYLDATGSR